MGKQSLEKKITVEIQIFYYITFFDMDGKIITYFQYVRLFLLNK